VSAMRRTLCHRSGAWLALALFAQPPQVSPARASDRPTAAQRAKPLAAPQSIDVPVPAVPRDNPAAIVDLRSAAGARLVAGVWRYADARPVKAVGRAVGPDLRASGAPLETLDIAPKAGARDFDDARWELVPPGQLEARRGPGRLSFGWYRLHLTLPEMLGGTPLRGGTLVFEVAADDYAEVWVDGVLHQALGQAGGGVVSGFNAPNRVVVTRDAQPGSAHVIAVFAMNGPLSVGPENFLWLRDAALELYPRALAGQTSAGRWTKRSPGLEALLDPNAPVERVAGGLQFAEGPVWSREGRLLFSDPNANRIYAFEPGAGLSVFRAHSGYSGADVGRYHQPGSNGLGIDAAGRLVAAEHGRRRVTRTEATGAITVLAERYQSKRLNSPNDLIVKSDGAVYFTDPPFGLPGVFDDPQKELEFSGIYRVAGGELSLLDASLTGPNGIAFSPDERTVYVTNWDARHKVVKAWDVAADGSLARSRIFFDMTRAPGAEALDGLEVDLAGNLYVSGPGGVWVLSPRGEHLGTLEVAELPANFAWGDDGKTLYMTARTSVYSLRTRIGGKRN
jgi:gluconolactonase